MAVNIAFDRRHLRYSKDEEGLLKTIAQIIQKYNKNSPILKNSLKKNLQKK